MQYLRMNEHFEMDEFLLELLRSRSPTGTEREAADIVEKYVSSSASSVKRDALGNRIATYGSGEKTLMLSGHIDEIGFIISYIDDDGFLFFDTLGGHDNVMLSGRRVAIMTKDGYVYGVTGKRAIHLMDAKERKEVPETYQVWIDIGAKNRAEAEKLVRIGDPVVYDTTVRKLSGNICTARAFDDRAGCYCVFELIRRLAKAQKTPAYKVVSVGSTQEEIGTRGAWTAAYGVNPDVGIAVDVTHATDFPSCNKAKFGSIKLGAGPVIARGPNINPKVFARLEECAKAQNIPYQVEAESRPTGTDARVLQTTRAGVATGLVSVPLRYMHTPSEVLDLADIEMCVRLLEAFALSLSTTDDFTY